MKLVCSVCGSRNIYKYISRGKWLIIKCEVCGLGWLTMNRGQEKKGVVYDEGYFSGKTEGDGGYSSYKDMEKELSKEAYKRFDYMERYNLGRKWLDIGAGIGTFLKIIREKGNNVAGNDISDFAIHEMVKRKIKTYPGEVGEGVLPKNSFDVITAWDVLEHMTNLKRAVKEIARALKSGGYFFFTTPNTESWDAKLMGPFWYGYKKLPEHVWFFNPRSLEILFNNEGLEWLEVRQWGFTRSVGFVMKKALKQFGLDGVAVKLADVVPINDKMMFVPVIDLIGVVKKV